MSRPLREHHNLNIVPKVSLVRNLYTLEMSGKRLFITGIPTAGKSHLANRLAEKVGGLHVLGDSICDELKKESEEYRKWIDFYWDQDEHTYYTTTSHEQQWINLVAQAEHVWPGILEHIKKYDNEEKPVIFDGVLVLPHLAKRDLAFPGVVLVGKSLEETLARNKLEPRWGDTEELQKLEAESFFYCERPRYIEEAQKYGYPVFEEPEAAYSSALELLQ